MVYAPKMGCGPYVFKERGREKRERNSQGTAKLTKSD